VLRNLRSRLTYANVVSTLCLFILLGGSAYAAVSISGSDIVNRSVPGKKLKKKAVTRAEVNFSKLGAVPRASKADQALNASRLGGKLPSGYLTSDRIQSSGFKRSDATVAGASTPLLTRGPVSFSSVCTDKGGGNIELDIDAASSESDSRLTNNATPGGQALTSTPTPVVQIGPFSSSDPSAFGPLGLSVLTPSTAFHGFATTGLNIGSHDCVAGVIVMP
jgi:hypothetical protein